MGSPWKALADDSRRQVLMLLKNKEKTPTEIATHFDFSLPALSTHLKVLKDAGLVSERKEGKNRYYSVKRDGMSDMMRFFNQFWDSRLEGLKQYVERKERKKRN